MKKVKLRENYSRLPLYSILNILSFFELCIVKFDHRKEVFLKNENSGYIPINLKDCFAMYGKYFKKQFFLYQSVSFKIDKNLVNSYNTKIVIKKDIVMFSQIKTKAKTMNFYIRYCIHVKDSALIKSIENGFAMLSQKEHFPNEIRVTINSGYYP